MKLTVGECGSGLVPGFSSLIRVSPQWGCSEDQSRQAKFSCQHFASIAKTGHSSFMKSILKLLRHLPPATLQKLLGVAKLACSSLAAFAFLTFSLRALKLNKRFLGRISTFFPSIKDLFLPII